MVRPSLYYSKKKTHPFSRLKDAAANERVQETAVANLANLVVVVIVVASPFVGSTKNESDAQQEFSLG
jgi:hypothetical protein